MIKHLAIGSLIFFSLPSIGHADSLILKSGEVLRGEVFEKNEKSYFIELAADKEKVEVPLSKVSIADIDTAAKHKEYGSSFIAFTKTGESESAKPVEHEKQTYRPVAVPGVAALPGISKSHTDILTKAQQTVADSNARTLATQKQLEEFKAIADAANS
jgi:hypothetical protein